MKHIRVSTEGAYKTSLRGTEVLTHPFLNKGVAFTQEERDQLGLKGLLPPAVLTLDDQSRRAYEQYSTQPNDLLKYVFLYSLRERNSVLYYRLITDHLVEMLPIIYTPTISLAVKEYSHLFQRARGVYLTIEDPESIEDSFKNLDVSADDIDLIVATDGERILGIGDWGVGGIGIANGKIAVYIAAAGIHPSRVISVILDNGTNRTSLLNDPLYIGYRHSRIRGERYAEFIDQYVKTVSKMFPQAILHWEDFGQVNARPILEKYRDKVCTFNDDIQGTGAVSLAVVLSAVRASGVPLRDHRIVLFGSGTAGIGVADQICKGLIREGLSDEEARRRFWCIDRPGLLLDNMTDLLDFQKPYARPEKEVLNWKQSLGDGGISLKDVVKHVHPTILIGLSTVGGAFTEEIIKEMVAHTERPIILPLSNPTKSAEAKPADLIEWTEGKALVATGSPFEPVTYNNVLYEIGQSNNAFVFPGIGLGTIVSRASRITDRMLEAAATTVASLVEHNTIGSSLLPDIKKLRAVSASVAIEVVKAAMEDGVASNKPEDIIQAVQDHMWQPKYPPIYAVQDKELMS
jgi:malate dehydrogenase (oxaloacetate-decarboxylating)